MRTHSNSLIIVGDTILLSMETSNQKFREVDLRIDQDMCRAIYLQAEMEVAQYRICKNLVAQSL